MPTDGQNTERWKQKYYDQLDRLDEKEKEWGHLEAVLKKAIGRLTVAAEGQNAKLDHYIRDVRESIKDKVNRHKLDILLDDLSRLLTELEANQAAPDRQIVARLQQLIEQLEFPSHCNKLKNKLLKQFSKLNDASIDTHMPDIVSLFSQAMHEQEKSPGLLGRLLGGDDKQAATADVQLISNILDRVVRIVPWPEKANSSDLLDEIKRIESHDDVERIVSQLEVNCAGWSGSIVAKARSGQVQGSNEDIEDYKDFIVSILNRLDNPDMPEGAISELRLTVRNAVEKSELYKLSAELSALIGGAGEGEASEIDGHILPGIQELLIRLLEQLVVPAELNVAVDEMKAHLEKDANPEDWRKLLKDVAVLINSIRSRIQQEKYEYEQFLETITSRLKEIDDFLQVETTSVETARKEGVDFDSTMETQVQNIKDDMTGTVAIDDLKVKVESRLNTISSHIKDYRKAEEKRYFSAQENIYKMQSRVLSLEKETDSLREVIVEKNKQAMFDALTGIPNRLYYEKKVAEEIARWKRFGEPLSVAVWDVDYFKKVNDVYGHKAGDKVLKTIAQLLNDRIRT
ncbi:MAG: GGDEF domain-containing protein, partial [Gammaproteobacteria bacterium]|nr:GGDEF domain-containing protein [Gammaproteobacteria bacterium]